MLRARLLLSGLQSGRLGELGLALVKRPKILRM